MRYLSEDTIQRIVSFVDEYYKENSFSPTIAEIAQNLSLATGTVHKYLHRMTELNKLRFDGRHIITPYIAELQEKFHSPIKNSIPPESSHIPTNYVDNGDYFWYRIKDCSMVNSGIDNGDWILIRKQDSENKCDDVTVSINNDATLVTLSYNQDTHQVILISECNEKEKHPNQNLDDISVKGVVVHILKKTR